MFFKPEKSAKKTSENLISEVQLKATLLFIELCALGLAKLIAWVLINI